MDVIAAQQDNTASSKCADSTSRLPAVTTSPLTRTTPQDRQLEQHRTSHVHRKTLSPTTRPANPNHHPAAQDDRHRHTL
jgi:hypothetical protein